MNLLLVFDKLLPLGVECGQRLSEFLSDLDKNEVCSVLTLCVKMVA